ncbi:exodeoxyribonuclease VII small subunit [Clostridium luticellarii]|jgi:exodeoxyribonuclease VII small subunit|uniref:Exodeoxyribonuclease 7 small subunit n=1 Tax=Clostridium luticellarii TaxID=1691940 RepID=A0A2T0BRN8_9CLOT|nr:exodeoxyribonuclease VII small subunit [Clostridium luticellarii]MCI1943754.1 exodeoxyribonuclease VII small subunit [Clostridium luticellarii]MCI1967015.1 exodeoxyribonuclease VII small subunit [Clostridium luticellarii]MCI1994382.1 exodeoxyribonuclease VII small subunit [Clostridium luticellarii]MCI2038665.1 exodeoxyribonuclease VII small subunit [Clostridium luticellarii]PRR86540.1 Exodeoxyribonuclease 7 small subunit [Clostridium luticellarii]
MPRKRESYEDVMLELENIVNSMDTGGLSLEKSMKSYEEGIKLCNKLYKMLNEAEGRIKILTEEGEKNFDSSQETN